MRAHNFTRKQCREIAERANGRCECCDAVLKLGEGDADHIIAVELGGESVIENGQWLCRPCHKEKTAKDIRVIRKVQRIRDRRSGAMRASHRPLPGSRASGVRIRMNRTVEPW